MFRAYYLLWAACLLTNLGGLTWAQERIPWITVLRQARQMAEQQQRPVLLHFWSESCAPCRLLEQNVFNQPELIRVMSTTVIPVKINVFQERKIADFYRVDRVPMDILVDPSGRELYRATSPQNMNGYLAMLDQVHAQLAVGAGKALEAMAQNPIQQFRSALPPMSNGTDDQPASEPVNSDPGLAPDTTRSWQGGSAGDASSQTTRPQPAFVQNQFANSVEQKAAPPVADTGPPEVAAQIRQHANDLLQQPDEPPLADQTTQQAAPTQPWQNPVAGVNPQPNLPSGPPPGTTFPQQPLYSTPTWQNAPHGNLSPPAPAMGVQQGAAGVPQNVPPLALDGYCPVTLVLLSKWSKGDLRFGAVHRGRTYLLGSQSDQQRFLADPDRFTPALSGYDPVRFVEAGQLVEGRREHGLSCGGTYYLFADEQALARFFTQPQGYVNVVRQAMSNMRPNVPQR